MRAARSIARALLLLAACGSSQRLPPPPPHDPANSPEADTPCHEDRERANQARERLLEVGTLESRSTAAAAVFAQAECERGHFASAEIAAATQDEMADRIRAARVHYQDAVNLYEEVPTHGAPRWSIGAQSRLGALHTSFASKLRLAPVPPEIEDPGEQSAFRAEIEELAVTFDRRASAAHAAALDTAAFDPGSVADDEAVSAWIRASCDSLARIDPAARRARHVCSD